MARPREFDIEKALDRAVDVFWQLGHEGAALPDLLTGMGISRGSFYKAYGGKSALFLKALTRYERDHIAPAIATLRKGGIAAIGQVFSEAVSAVRDGDRRGCLLCNAASSETGPEARAAITSILARLKDAFAVALERKVTNPDVRRARARALTATYVGLRILARAGEPIGVLEATAREAERFAG